MRYKYIEQAPKRHPFDPVYFMFKDMKTGDYIYRKAFRFKS